MLDNPRQHRLKLEDVAHIKWLIGQLRRLQPGVKIPYTKIGLDQTPPVTSYSILCIDRGMTHKTVQPKERKK